MYEMIKFEDMTKQQKKEICQDILKRGYILLIDHEFLMNLIQGHPEKDLKIGCGILYFFVKETVWNNKCFWICRKDNTRTDFSYLQCLNNDSPKNRQMNDAKQAARNAVNRIIQKAKLFKHNEMHHHYIKFNKSQKKLIYLLTILKSDV